MTVEAKVGTAHHMKVWTKSYNINDRWGSWLHPITFNANYIDWWQCGMALFSNYIDWWQCQHDLTMKIKNVGFRFTIGQNLHTNIF